MKQKYSDAQLATSVARCRTYAAVLRDLGAYSASGTAHRNLKVRVAALGLDTSHFQTRGEYNKPLHPRPSVLVLSLPGEPVSDMRTISKALISSGVEKKCLECGNPGEWQGKSLRLHLDHIDGNRRDNRKTNLRFLCPNCHDQTETWGRSHN